MKEVYIIVDFDGDILLVTENAGYARNQQLWWEDDGSWVTFHGPCPVREPEPVEWAS